MKLAPAPHRPPYLTELVTGVQPIMPPPPQTTGTQHSEIGRHQDQVYRPKNNRDARMTMRRSAEAGISLR
ncbi:hypothetical protein AB1N83_007103 [Pleurotus pulmonarius]